MIQEQAREAKPVPMLWLNLCLLLLFLYSMLVVGQPVPTASPWLARGFLQLLSSGSLFASC